MSEDSQSGFNYYNAEWGGKFTSLDLACIIIYFFAVLADLSLAKWSRCRSKLTTLVAILCWLLVNVIAILFQAVSSRVFTSRAGLVILFVEVDLFFKTFG